MGEQNNVAAIAGESNGGSTWSPQGRIPILLLFIHVFLTINKYFGTILISYD